jgi:hypothetical protein
MPWSSALLPQPCIHTLQPTLAPCHLQPTTLLLQVSNYAKPGKRCRHNAVYWSLQPYYGWGLGAASYLGQRRLSRPASMKQYQAWVEASGAAGVGCVQEEGDQAVTPTEVREGRLGCWGVFKKVLLPTMRSRLLQLTHWQQLLLLNGRCALACSCITYGPCSTHTDCCQDMSSLDAWKPGAVVAGPVTDLSAVVLLLSCRSSMSCCWTP